MHEILCKMLYVFYFPYAVVEDYWIRVKELVFPYENINKVKTIQVIKSGPKTIYIQCKVMHIFFFYYTI